MTLHVEESGVGPGVVLAHGFAGSARNFRPQVRALRDRYRVVTYDAPGHARSPAPRDDPDAYALPAFVSAFGAAADRAAGAEPIVAGGLSMGAATALLYALEHPGRVRALVLASLPGGRGAAGSVSAGALEFARAIDEDGLEAAGERYVWGPSSGLDAAAGRLVRQGFLEHPPHALSAALRGFLLDLPRVEELAPRLRRLDRPALVLAGSDDRASLEPSRAIARAIPGARLIEIEGAGHVVNLSRPDVFNAELLGFLDGLPPVR